MSQQPDSRDGPCRFCGKICRAIGDSFDACNTIVEFTPDTLARTAFWCSKCGGVLCGACITDTARADIVGRCPKCKAKVDYAKKINWKRSWWRYWRFWRAGRSQPKPIEIFAYFCVESKEHAIEAIQSLPFFRNIVGNTIVVDLDIAIDLATILRDSREGFCLVRVEGTITEPQLEAFIKVMPIYRNSGFHAHADEFAKKLKREHPRARIIVAG